MPVSKSRFTPRANAILEIIEDMMLDLATEMREVYDQVDIKLSISAE